MAAAIAVEAVRRCGVVEPLPRRGKPLLGRRRYLLRRRPERPGAAASDSPALQFPTPIETRRSTARRHRNPSRLRVRPDPPGLPGPPCPPFCRKIPTFTGNPVLA